ncbi:MAG: hypothetical protein AB8B60_17225 [Sulfitobacter sp.]
MSELADSLLKSSKFFTVEAVNNAITADEGANERWQLAVFHIVTALEHSSKALLATAHPVFVRDKFETTNRTVGIDKTFKRLADKEVLGISFSKKDLQRIQTAIDVRNSIAHGSTGPNFKALEAKFFEIFAFQREFYLMWFNLRLEDFLEIQAITGLLKIKKQTDAFKKRALDALRQDQDSFMCAECGQDFLVIEADDFLCLFCHSKEPFNSCDRCQTPIPEHLMSDASEIFEYRFSEGQADLVSDYGILEKAVCDQCFVELENEARVLREERLLADWEEEEYYFQLQPNTPH